MKFILDFLTQSLIDRRHMTSISALFYLKGVGANTQLRYCYSVFNIFNTSEVGFSAKSCFGTLYVRNIGFNVVFWMDMRPSFIKCSLILYLQTSLKHGLVRFISISYVLAKSSALVIQLVNPCSCKRFKWFDTCFTNCESGIWCNRLQKPNNDTRHDKLGGKRPHSPYTARLLIWLL